MFTLLYVDRISEDDVVKPGRLISGVVERVTPNSIIISSDVNGYMKGTLSTEHLADNQGDITSCLYALASPCFHLIS